MPTDPPSADRPNAADAPALRPTVLVTGSSGGIGRALATRLADAGWRVLLHGRDAAKLSRTRDALGGDATHDAFQADLADPASVRQLAADVRAVTDRLDGLVHNAGAIFPSRGLTAGGVERTMAVHAIAPFVLTDALRPLLEATVASHGGARVVTVSSEAQSRRLPPHEPGALADALRDPTAPGRYSPLAAYGRAKLVATVWTLELARRLEGTGVTAHACHPGVVRTGIFWGLGGPNGFFASLFSFLYLPPSVGAESPYVLLIDPRYGRETGRWVTRGHLRGPHEADPPAPARAPESGAAVWDALGRLAGEPDTG